MRSILLTTVMPAFEFMGFEEPGSYTVHTLGSDILMSCPWLQWWQPRQYFRLIVGGDVVIDIFGVIKIVCSVERMMIMAERLWHFSIFTVANAVEREVLVDLGSSNAISWNWGKAGLMVKPCAALTTIQPLHPIFVTQTLKGHLCQKCEQICIRLWESYNTTPSLLFGML